MTGRPSADQYFMAMASIVATRGTCARRRVGCILVDGDNHVLATGYNGPPARMAHCTKDKPCSQAAFLPSGQGLGSCAAVHAEQNALLQCSDTGLITTAYCTTSPCEHCVKMLLNTSCRRIVFLEPYPSTDAARWWVSMGREWDKFTVQDDDPLGEVYTAHQVYHRIHGQD